MKVINCYVVVSCYATASLSHLSSFMKVINCSSSHAYLKPWHHVMSGTIYATSLGSTSMLPLSRRRAKKRRINCYVVVSCYATASLSHLSSFMKVINCSSSHAYLKPWHHVMSGAIYATSLGSTSMLPLSRRRAKKRRINCYVVVSCYVTASCHFNCQRFLLGKSQLIP